MFRPVFTLTQDESFVHVHLVVRYLRPDDIKFFLGEHEFRFLAMPYALKLHFNECIEEDGSEKASYCVESGTLTVRLPKQTEGQHFTQLDQPDQLVEEDPHSEAAGNESRESFHYGFNNQYSGVFKGLENFEEEILESPEPESTSPEDRVELRILAEESKFDGDYYLGDLVSEDDFSHVLNYEPWWTKLAEGTPPSFSEQDDMLLARFQPKQFLLESEKSIHCILIDILFAYVHQELVMNGQESCEASWSISRLSRTLSWLDSSLESPLESLIVSYRRALAYPLYRNWNLCQKVHHFVAQALLGGPLVVLKCFLNIHHAMTHNSEKRYLLNLIFTNDLLSYIQASDAEVFQMLGHVVQQCVISKESVGFSLLELEQLAQDAEAVDYSGLVDHMDIEEIDLIENTNFLP